MKKIVTKVAKPKSNLNFLLVLLVISLVIMAAAISRMKNSLDSQSSAAGGKKGYPTIPWNPNRVDKQATTKTGTGKLSEKKSVINSIKYAPTKSYGGRL